MSLTARATNIPGTLRQHVLIDHRHLLITDEPPDVGGDGGSPAPHELLPAALASCISTMLVLYARTKEWTLETVTVEVDYDNHSTPRRFEISIDVTGELTTAQLGQLEKVAKACPVRRALESAVEFDERLTLNERALSA